MDQSGHILVLMIVKGGNLDTSHDEALYWVCVHYVQWRLATVRWRVPTEQEAGAPQILPRHYSWRYVPKC